MSEKYNYKNDVNIDEYNLDKEFMIQASMTMKWYEYYIQLEQKVAKLKKQLELLEATLDKHIRENPPENIKLTETYIKNSIIMNNEYQRLKTDIINTEYDTKIAKAAVSAMQDKKKSLEHLWEMYYMGYNAEPRQNIKDKILDSVQDKIRGGLK